MTKPMSGHHAADFQARRVAMVADRLRRGEMDWRTVCFLYPDLAEALRIESDLNPSGTTGPDADAAIQPLQGDVYE